MKRPTAHVWLLGQDDNIGDVVLRRRLLRFLADHFEDVNVYVGRASEGYIEGLTLGTTPVIYRNSRKWLASAFRASMLGDWGFAFNPGEVRAVRQVGLLHLALIPILALARLRGAAIINIGLGLGPDPRQPWLVALRGAFRLAQVSVWREKVAASTFGFGSVAPDLAFDEHLEEQCAETGPRTYLAVTYRGDQRMLDATMLDGLRKFAESKNLELIVFSQVRSDADRSRELSEALHCGLLDWPSDRSHIEQERRVRALMNKSVFVASDRIHALIIGVTQGCTPLGAVASGANKVERHLAAAGIDAAAFDMRLASSDEIVQQLNSISSQYGPVELAGPMAAVRSRLDDISRLLRLDLPHLARDTRSAKSRTHHE